MRQGPVRVRKYRSNMLIRLMIFSSVVALGACGRSSPAAPTAEIEQLRVLASGVVSTAEAYGVRSGSMTDHAACRAARAGYDEQVRPRIEGMVALAPRVDRWLQARGPDDHADTECSTSTLLDELDRHLAIACSSPDLAANRAEAARHLEAVDRWADLSVARAAEASAAMASGSAENDGRGPRCVRFSDGKGMYLP
jgi:hypothetical protein